MKNLLHFIVENLIVINRYIQLVNQNIVETLPELRNILLGYKILVHTDHKKITCAKSNVIKLLIFSLTNGGVSKNLSPKTIMSGKTLDYKKNMSLKIGQYCQEHEEDNPRNSQIAWTKGTISLGPSGNLQGGFKFIALNTGKKIVRCSWDVIPMPDLVIARVNALGSDQPQDITFTDIHSRLISIFKSQG
jgi:hypothetical protein